MWGRVIQCSVAGSDVEGRRTHIRPGECEGPEVEGHAAVDRYCVRKGYSDSEKINRMVSLRLEDRTNEADSVIKACGTSSTLVCLSRCESGANSGQSDGHGSGIGRTVSPIWAVCCRMYFV